MGVTLIVKRIIAEIIFWIVNIVLIIMSFMTDRPLASFVTTIICSTPMNPLLLNRIQRKIDGNKFDFWYYNYILDGFNCQCIAKNEWYNPPLER